MLLTRLNGFLAANPAIRLCSSRAALCSFGSTAAAQEVHNRAGEDFFVESQANLFRKSVGADAVIVGHASEIPAKAYYVGKSIDIQLVYNHHQGKKILRNDNVILFSPFCTEVSGVLEGSAAGVESEEAWVSQGNQEWGDSYQAAACSSSNEGEGSSSSSGGNNGSSADHRRDTLLQQALYQVVQRDHRQRHLSDGTLQSMLQQMNHMAQHEQQQQEQQQQQSPQQDQQNQAQTVRWQQQQQQQPLQEGQRWSLPSHPAAVPAADFYRIPPGKEIGIMVVHSFGSAVFFGVEVGEHWPLLKVMLGGGATSEPVPTSLITEDGNEWRLTDPEELEVSVRGELEQWAVKGEDRLVVRQLDMGTLQLVAAVMAQSIALRYHVWMVDAAANEIHSLRRRAVASNSSSSSSSGVTSLDIIRSYTWLGPSATTNDLARLVANANKVAIEVSRNLQLLEYPKLAWQRDRYDEVWSLLRSEFELQRMLGVMNKKLKNMAQEVQYDMETMFQWRYDYLVAIVILLLVAGNCLDVWDILQELLPKSG